MLRVRIMIEYKNGIHIVDTNLWLDSRDPQDLCFVSHGHVDHLGSHATIIVSKPTALFYEQRLRPTKAIILEYHEPYTLEGMTVELLPAGHILGSSQIVIKKGAETIIYSGDIKLKPNSTAEQIDVEHADILIMEATYGNPRYLFPDRDVVINQLCNVIDATFSEGRIPIVLAYSLGKGQEVAKVLGEKGYALLLHNTIYDLLKTYEEFGIEFKNYEKFTSTISLKNKVFIMPPYVLSSNVIQNIKQKKTIMLSGWALDASKKRSNIDIMLPLSDHADFNELLQYVRMVNPRQTYVTHGDPHFVEYLSQIGYAASFLGSSFTCK